MIQSEKKLNFFTKNPSFNF